MSIIDTAVNLAVLSHTGQVDKSGQPYILHPLRVMLRGIGYNQMIVGVLHDVVEDTAVTVEQIRNLFGTEIADAVDALSHRQNEPIVEYMARVVANPLAATVKRYDIEDNMDERRMRCIDAATAERLHRKHIKMLSILWEGGYGI